MPRTSILFLISSLNIGGAERQTTDLVNKMDSARFAVSLCYFVQCDTLKWALQLERLTGLYCLEKRRRFDFGCLQRLNVVIQTTKPDVVVCVNPYPGFYAHLLRMIYRKKFRLIEIMHSTKMPDRYNDFFMRCLYAPLANRSDRVVFVCQNQMHYWITIYGINKNLCTFIYNGIDIDHFDYRLTEIDRGRLMAKLGLTESDTVICICATLAKHKRHVDLIDAAQILLKRGYATKLLMVGDGAERGNIERHIERQQMKDAVIITGFQQDVRPYVAIADIFVIASSSVETFSIAILEAMALGKAIIASDIGGASEQIINNVNGFLFPPGDVIALADCLESIISKGVAAEMGERSREIVRETFTAERMVKQYEVLFEEVQRSARIIAE